MLVNFVQLRRVRILVVRPNDPNCFAARLRTVSTILRV
jgi:hypothetical protein